MTTDGQIDKKNDDLFSALLGEWYDQRGYRTGADPGLGLIGEIRYRLMNGDEADEVEGEGGTETIVAHEVGTDIVNPISSDCVPRTVRVKLADGFYSLNERDPGFGDNATISSRDGRFTVVLAGHDRENGGGEVQVFRFMGAGDESRLMARVPVGDGNKRGTLNEWSVAVTEVLRIAGRGIDADVLEILLRDAEAAEALTWAVPVEVLGPNRTAVKDAYDNLRHFVEETAADSVSLRNALRVLLQFADEAAEVHDDSEQPVDMTSPSSEVRA